MPEKEKVDAHETRKKMLARLKEQNSSAAASLSKSHRTHLFSGTFVSMMMPSFSN